MKNIFYFGIFCVILFEILKTVLLKFSPIGVDIKSVEFAYFLHFWRWDFRLLFWLFIVFGLFLMYEERVWKTLTPYLISACLITYLTNFVFVSEFKVNQDKAVQLSYDSVSDVTNDSEIIGVAVDSIAKAYPIHMVSNHYQIVDTIGDKLAMITFCKICRKGSVYEPIINGKSSQFALVGKDYCTAMLEDFETGSWWRQSDGVALTGKMKGSVLSELNFEQVSLQDWLRSYPNTEIMKPSALELSESSKVGYKQNKKPEVIVETGSKSRSLVGIN